MLHSLGKNRALKLVWVVTMSGLVGHFVACGSHPANAGGGGGSGEGGGAATGGGTATGGGSSSGGGSAAGGGVASGGGTATGGGSASGGGSATGGGSASGGGSATGGGSAAGGGTAIVDDDHDGLDDAFEQRLAEAYLPVIAVDPNDNCPLGGFIVRVRPHPTDPSLVHILYDHLYQADCGINGHSGDDEVFAITVDPAKPAPAGITAMKAISHQGTACEKDTTCGVCNGLNSCDGEPDGGKRPVLYASKDKHGSYARLTDCNPFTTCLDTCSFNDVRNLPIVNVGEPDAHFVEDLTDAGFITTANGWTEMSLFHFNPWQPGAVFGGAGVVADDLVDPSFDTAACQ